ncbi:hypothetical protein [Pseudoduganella sp. OTU4001]|uniref:hypothetical protein n=1 Tax=Pseudoduganella sp. OTU4001 TaxID=3043854 RepID=UPI00313D21FB
MNDIVTLAISPSTMLRLLHFVSTHSGAASAGETAAQAIEDWLNRAQQEGNKPTVRRRGYQWKTIFLPEGTQLRAWNRSNYAYAEVVGDEILHKGAPVSPHQFICACKGISRSAWAEIAILFPDADAWKVASACRKEAASRPPSPAAAPATCLPNLGSITGPEQAKPAPAPTRLPRIAPIPTQAKRLAARAPSPCIAFEENWPAAKDRRQGYRRAEDLLLD